MLPPGSTIGILGGGQLARMLCVAAAQLGYRTHIYAPEPSGPASDVSARWTAGAYHDRTCLAAWAATLDVATYEFENVDVDPLVAVEAAVPIYPPLAALRVAQDRVAEKRFAEQEGARTADWAEVVDRAALASAIAKIGTPAILKTTRFGYDGKGQASLATPDDADRAWAEIGAGPAILEARMSFEHEFSILLSRGRDGRTVTWAAPVNVHRNGILATSTLPAPTAIADSIEQAQGIARRIADALDYVGTLAVEFFAIADGPIFNEMAPRVHNSGHWTIEGAVTSQFENHIRAIAGLPLGSVALSQPDVTMRNLIGDDIDAWPALFAEPGAHVHLYGKATRPGRKMGHVTRVG
jgi:5-(carboxyamino)imidazole ribonucleotide synthase